MKALTLHQPYASAIALGIKGPETRSWRTSYRGPLAIHAGQRRPPMQHIPPTRFTRDLAKQREVDAHNRSTYFVCDTISDPAYQRPLRTNPPERVPRRALTPTLFLPVATHPWDSSAGTSATEQGTAVYLPLGAIVATGLLVDVVPIGGPTSFSTGIMEGEACPTAGMDVVVEHGTLGPLVIDRWNGGVEDITDQRPWGDYTPGRWAWLLDDVKPTTERCPACWGAEPFPVTDPDCDAPDGAVLPIARHMGWLFSRHGEGWEPAYCETCGGVGRCDPVPARGRQSVWEWTP